MPDIISKKWAICWRNAMYDQKEKFMKAALLEAKKARLKDEVPVGAVVVYDGKIVARAHNLRNTACDGTAHAEILAIKKAGKKLMRWNLSDCDIYVTLEPCAMCAGAMVNSRIRKVYFGAFDHRYGCCGSIMNIVDSKLNHKVEVEGGVLESDCALIISSFFKNLREKAK